MLIMRELFESKIIEVNYKFLVIYLEIRFPQEHDKKAYRKKNRMVIQLMILSYFCAAGDKPDIAQSGTAGFHVASGNVFAEKTTSVTGFYKKQTFFISLREFI